MKKEQVRELVAKARKGDVEAQGSLVFYHLSQKNGKAAKKWLERAVDGGNPLYMNLLADWYEQGFLVEKDPAQAIRLRTVAAQKGDGIAQQELADRYWQGELVEKDVDKAIALWQSAAEQGNALAMMSLGERYYYGQGVAQNAKQAVDWLLKGMGTYLEENPYVYQEDTFKIDSVYYLLGDCALHGKGMEKDCQKAIEYWYAGSDHQEGVCQMALADLYSQGKHIKPDDKAALHWFKKAAFLDSAQPQKGVPEACYQLACMYEKGKGVAKDQATALSYFRRTLETYGNRNPQHDMKQEPNFVTKARLALIQKGDRAMLHTVLHVAKQGDKKAGDLLARVGKTLVKTAWHTKLHWEDVQDGKGFLEELTQIPGIDLAPDTKVLHKTFGAGRVLTTTKQTIRVAFENGAEKSFGNPHGLIYNFLKVVA